jgi:hypothetical protein
LGLDASSLIAGLFVSSVGFVLFSYGKKMSRPPQMAGGLLLMVFPYFVRRSVPKRCSKEAHPRGGAPCRSDTASAERPRGRRRHEQPGASSGDNVPVCLQPPPFRLLRAVFM